MCSVKFDQLTLLIEFGFVVMDREYIEVVRYVECEKLEWFKQIGLGVTIRYVPSPDDIVIQIRRVRESASPLFSATVGSIFVEDWTRVMSQNFKAFSVPKSLKVKIAYLFLREEPIAWFKRAAQPYV